MLVNGSKAVGINKYNKGIFIQPPKNQFILQKTHVPKNPYTLHQKFTSILPVAIMRRGTQLAMVSGTDDAEDYETYMKNREA